jgi:hypothetical protein
MKEVCFSKRRALKKLGNIKLDLLNKKSLDVYLEIWSIHTNWKALKLSICIEN